MKFLLVAAVLLLAFYIWRNNRQSEARDNAAPRREPPPGLPLPMVSCAHCGLHLPRSDAIEGDAGRFYCGAAHRAAAGR